MKKRKKKERIIPMPTEEDKMRAQLKAASADPLVWAMKSVDEKFPDEREKDAETVMAEAEIEEDTRLDEETEAGEVDTSEIAAEGKTVLPTEDGAITVEVTPMRQNMDGVAAAEEKAEKPAEKLADKSFDKSTEKKPVVAIKTARPNVKVPVPGQKKMMIGLVASIILALAGLTFGIVAMINQNHATLELANQIVNSGASENKVDENYIYVNDWGMKIKLVSGLSNVSFDIDDNDYGSILVWGARRDSGANYVPDFAKQSKNSNAMGTLTRVPRYERSAAGRLIWYDDYYNYYYQGPTSEPEANEVEMSWWVESYLLIKEMLTNADNYVAIDDSTISQQ